MDILTPLTASTVQTQKAKGIFALNDVTKLGKNSKKSYFSSHAKQKQITGIPEVPDFQCFSTKELLRALKHHSTNNIILESIISESPFIRPCPIKPRHGFVDSRKVKTLAKLKSLAKETYKADKHSELICMPALTNAIASAVVTPKTITIGPSNDGATKGRGTITLPISELFLPKGLLSKAGITESPYIEALYPKISKTKKGKKYSDDDDDSVVKVVQLRNGPKVSASKDYVPKTIKVKQILTVKNQDLLDWEEQCAKAKPGTVIYFPNGSMTSHYSIHGVANKIPVITTFKPTLGQKLSKTNDQAKPNYKKIREGIKYGMGLKIPPSSEIRQHQFLTDVCMVAIFAVHHSTELVKSEEGCYLFGMAAALLYKLGAAACLGEDRHYYYNYVKGNHKIKQPKAVALLNLNHTSYSSRSYVWKKVFSVKQSLVHKLLLDAVHHFCFFDGWYDDSKTAHNKELKNLSSYITGYGGIKWGLCTIVTLTLEKALGRFYKNPTEATLSTLLKRMNYIVNISHNGSSLLTKFLDTDVMDSLADAKLNHLLTSAFIYYGLRTNLTKAKVSRPKFTLKKLVVTTQQKNNFKHKVKVVLSKSKKKSKHKKVLFSPESMLKLFKTLL